MTEPVAMMKVEAVSNCCLRPNVNEQRLRIEERRRAPRTRVKSPLRNCFRRYAAKPPIRCFFARLDAFYVDLDRLRHQAEFPRRSISCQRCAEFEQRFRGHAPAQNTKSANLGPAFDYHDARAHG